MEGVVCVLCYQHACRYHCVWIVIAKQHHGCSSDTMVVTYTMLLVGFN